MLEAHPEKISNCGREQIFKNLSSLLLEIGKDKKRKRRSKQIRRVHTSKNMTWERLKKINVFGRAGNGI